MSYLRGAGNIRLKDAGSGEVVCQIYPSFETASVLTCGFSDMQDEVNSGTTNHLDPVMDIVEPAHDIYQGCKYGHLSGYRYIGAYMASFGEDNARGFASLFLAVCHLLRRSRETFPEVIRFCPSFLSCVAQSKFQSSNQVKPEYYFQFSMVFPLRSLKAYHVLCLAGWSISTLTSRIP